VAGKTQKEKEVSREVSKRESYFGLRSPARRLWEETTERVVSVEEIRYVCRHCGYNWSKLVRSKPVVSKTRRELHPRDWPFI
jgi:ribosomal protein L44E